MTSARPALQEKLIKRDFGSRSHVSRWISAQESPTLGAGLHLIMEKLSRRWRCCLVSARGTRLINNRLSETCAHHCLSGQNLRDVQASRKKEPSLPITAGLTHGPPAAAQGCPKEVVFLIVLIQSSTSQAGDAFDEKLKVTRRCASAKEGRDARCTTRKKSSSRLHTNYFLSDSHSNMHSGFRK